MKHKGVNQAVGELLHGTTAPSAEQMGAECSPQVSLLFTFIFFSSEAHPLITNPDLDVSETG